MSIPQAIAAGTAGDKLSRVITGTDEVSTGRSAIATGAGAALGAAGVGALSVGAGAVGATAFAAAFNPLPANIQKPFQRHFIINWHTQTYTCDQLSIQALRKS